jgi:hypothetical protein
MAVRVETKAFSDNRIAHLGAILETSRYDALGRCCHIWEECTQRNSHILPEEVVNLIVDSNALVKAGLGAKTKRGIRIRGTKGRIEWLAKLRKNSEKGGEATRKRAEARRLANRQGQKASPTTTTTTTLKAKNQNPPSPPKGGKSKRTRPKGPPEAEVKEAAKVFIESFNRNFGRRVRPDTYLDAVRSAMRAGFSLPQLRAAQWAAAQYYADWPEGLKNFTPMTILRLKSREGRNCLPQWFGLADELWDQHDMGERIWLSNNSN